MLYAEPKRPEDVQLSWKRDITIKKQEKSWGSTLAEHSMGRSMAEGSVDAKTSEWGRACVRARTSRGR